MAKVKIGPMEKARTLLLLENPFFGMISLRLKLKEDPNCSSAWTDGTYLGYNRDWIDTLTIEQTKGLIAHEVLHIAFMHHLRRGNREPSLWNTACVRGDTLITMEGGATKQITEIKEGDLILGEENGKIVTSKVLTTLSKYDDMLEVCMDSGRKLYCTPTHKILTEEGYVEAGKAKGSAFVDATGIGFYIPKLYYNDDSGISKKAGATLQASRLLSTKKSSVWAKKNSKEKESKNRTSDRNRLGLFSRVSGRRRNYNNSENSEGILSSYLVHLKHKFPLGKIYRKLRILHNLEKEYMGESVLENGNKWIPNYRFTPEYAALSGYKECSFKTYNRIYNNTTFSEASRETNTENEGYIPRDSRIKPERITTVRRLETKQRVFDLTTTTHSYIANGIIVHNCDGAINANLQNAGFYLPPDGIFGYGVEETAEEIYNKLQKDNKGSSKGKGTITLWGDVRDASNEDGSGLSEEQRKLAEQEVKVMVVSAAQQAKDRGILPASIQRMVQEIIAPKLDWRQVLRNFVDESARNDYNWTRPNKRFIAHGFYMPEIRNHELGTVVIAEDTSGSVGDKALVQFNSEVSSILEEFDTTIHFLPVDAEVHDPQEFTKHDLPLRAKNTGGGGTSFIPPFKYVEDHEIDPVCMIYLTDGYCNEFPAEHPSYPVLWVVSEAYDSMKKTVPFGDVLKIEVE